jgi:hypothetical protein
MIVATSSVGGEAGLTGLASAFFFGAAVGLAPLPPALPLSSSWKRNSLSSCA